MPSTRRARSKPRPFRRRAPARRSVAIIAVIAIAIVAGGAFAIFEATRNRAPTPPALKSLGPLAPEIEDIVRQALKSVEERPRDGGRWGRLGMVCEANGLAGAARDAYGTATTLQSTEAKWWFHLASVEARLGHTDDAVRDMRRAIEVNPTYAPAFWHLGLWLLDENQIEGAERAFNSATEIQPNDRAGWIGLSRVYLQRGENARAAGLLERLVSARGGDSYVLQLLGTAYRRLGRADEAASALGAGAKGEPQWSDPWTDEMSGFRRGYAALLKDATAYIVAGQFDPAIRILEQLRRTKPDDLVLMAHLGQVYVAAGREDEGVPLLEQVTAKEPDRFEAYVDLATGYMHQDQLAKARVAVERALSIEGAFGPAYETLGLILWRGGDPRGAIAAFNTAVRSDPRNTRALVWMAMAQTNLGRTADALVTFERASRADPTSVDAWIGIANAELTLHDLDAAAGALQNAERLQPDRPAVKETANRLQTLRAESGTGRSK
ncbi:MAG TPA: tetratricopeptide repeat protein [Vicinamibacterales bacterium]|nr:tetratricopeptide repeat protein [Vicinamibacterales bacterium]